MTNRMQQRTSLSLLKKRKFLKRLCFFPWTFYFVSVNIYLLFEMEHCTVTHADPEFTMQLSLNSG